MHAQTMPFSAVQDVVRTRVHIDAVVFPSVINWLCLGMSGRGKLAIYGATATATYSVQSQN